MQQLIKSQCVGFGNNLSVFAFRLGRRALEGSQKSKMDSLIAALGAFYGQLAFRDGGNALGDYSRFRLSP
jgi:hypothetical protein